MGGSDIDVFVRRHPAVNQDVIRRVDQNRLVHVHYRPVVVLFFDTYVLPTDVLAS